MNIEWQKIQSRLESLDGVIYYAGGTLCVDFPEGGFIGLNLCGGWFCCLPGMPEVTGKRQPEEVYSLVKKVYLKTKGENSHYIIETGELACA